MLRLTEEMSGSRGEGGLDSTVREIIKRGTCRKPPRFLQYKHRNTNLTALPFRQMEATVLVSVCSLARLHNYLQFY